MNSIFLVVFFILLVALSFWQSRALKSRTLFLLRAFFPSWKFFEDLGHQPLILFRVGPTKDDLGPWQRLIKPLKRSVTHVVISPRGNLLHAYINHLHHFIEDLNSLTETDSVADTVSYQITKNIVEYEMARASITGAFYQFKVAIAPMADANGKIEDVVISPVESR